MWLVPDSLPTSDEPSLEAPFHTLDSRLIEGIVTMGIGMASIGGASSVTGAAADAVHKSLFPARRGKPLPHRLLVRTDRAGVHIYSSDRKGSRGPLVLEAPAGTYSATLNRNIGAIEVTLFIHGRDPIALMGKWGPFRRQPMRVARALAHEVGPV
jgi:hypothetical protein